MRLIGIYGGTFDPVHFGHLRPAVELREDLGLHEVRLIPAGVPPHRGEPVSGARDRLAMVRLAVDAEPGLVADDRELRREGPSYTVDTLLSLSEDLDGAALCLIMGLDAFLGLDTWHRWRELNELAHLVIAHRPGWHADPAAMRPAVRALYESALVEDPETLGERASGSVVMHAVTQLDISATDIRRLAGEGRSLRFLTPDPVVEYIRAHRLYRQSEDMQKG